MAGTQQKSIEQKNAQGTNRKANIIILDLAPLDDMPVCPTYFNEHETWFYETTCEALYNAGLLRSADLMTIESMAGWWSIMKESQRDIRENGLIQTAEKTGWQNLSPSVVIFEKAWNKLKDFSDRYGFNLVSKDKISAPAPKDPKMKELESLMNG